VYDLEAETDAPIIGWGRFSDISEPGSPSAASTLDRAAARAAAAVAAAEESDSTNRDSEFGMLSTLDLPEIMPISSSSVFSSQSLGESLQPGLEGPSARDAIKIPAGTFPPLEGSEFLGVGQSVSVSAAQSKSLGVGQSVSESVVQSVTEAAPSVGTLDIGRTAGPTPGAGEVPIPTTECQGNQEPPDESRASDFELVPPTGEVVTPDIE